MAMVTKQYGAHEVMELQDVLNSSIDGINICRLFLAYAKDSLLQQIILNQLRFMTDEYNGLVHFINGRGGSAAIPYRTIPSPVQQPSSPPASFTPATPMANLITTSPLQSPQAVEVIDDRDVSSAILGMHKAAATMRMHAALECSDQEIRNTLLNSAVNCAHQAYEIWGYMSQRGYYPTTTMPATSRGSLLRDFQPIPPQAQETEEVAMQAEMESAQPAGETAELSADKGEEAAASKRKKTSKA